MVRLIFILLLIQIVLDSLGDGFRVKGKRRLHHLCESLQIVTWFSILYIASMLGSIPIVNTVIYYVALRFLIFDTLYNLIVGNPNISYVGDPKNSWYARLWRIFEDIGLCSSGSAANTFKYLIALPTIIAIVYKVLI
jgi:hypothetical protein